jgi:hypothetical protein
LLSNGSSCWQGTHQVAQKFSTTTSPARSVDAIFSPLKVTAWKTGAGFPTFGVASAGSGLAASAAAPATIVRRLKGFMSGPPLKGAQLPAYRRASQRPARPQTAGFRI